MNRDDLTRLNNWAAYKLSSRRGRLSPSGAKNVSRVATKSLAPWGWGASVGVVLGPQPFRTS